MYLCEELVFSTELNTGFCAYVIFCMLLFACYFCSEIYWRRQGVADTVLLARIFLTDLHVKLY